ncbi:MAG: hypothetical protein M5U14_20220 [Acidimicrobiia bacterium]|nr:hypothetical protein [Acidimicrobiia bacterium]
MALVTERDVGTGGSGPPSQQQKVPAEPVVKLPRRTVDAILIALGVVVMVVLVVAGGLLTWGANFAHDHVNDELTEQQIFFPEAASLEEQGRTDLLKYAGEQVTTGQEANAYASYIDGHLEGMADGQTYAELGGPEREARDAVTAAQESGASEEEIAELQATASRLTSQRDSVFKGETLRGLLLSTYAWSTIGRIAGIAAIVAFAAAGVMLVLVGLGLWHHHKVVKA